MKQEIEEEEALIKNSSAESETKEPFPIKDYFCNNLKEEDLDVLNPYFCIYSLKLEDQEIGE